MSQGDHVEVLRVGPLTYWARGYAFVRRDGHDVIVRVEHGTFTGCEVRYAANKVRAI